ncbi:MAG: ROK family protein [Microlunatus sp.]|nr:ROK family protein [Microlunatus sp.]
MASPTAGTEPQRVPALEIGGSHVTAALADCGSGRLLPGHRIRLAVDPHGAAEEILGAWIAAARRLGVRSPIWGVAMPGPFDYQRGIGDFAGVGKFAALSGHDVGSALAAGVGGDVRIGFTNDADAYALGEWLSFDEPRPRRVVGITLGTGVGSGFVDDGSVVTTGPEVPAEGSAYRLEIGGRPLEETASTRAVLAAYSRRRMKITNVEELTLLARNGDGVAQQVFHDAWSAAAQALAPYISAFGARHIIVGGSIARSWDLVRPALIDGLASWSPTLPTAVDLRPSADPEAAALLGAAYAAQRRFQSAA